MQDHLYLTNLQQQEHLAASDDSFLQESDITDDSWSNLVWQMF